MKLVFGQLITYDKMKLVSHADFVTMATVANYITRGFVEYYPPISPLSYNAELRQEKLENASSK